MSDPIDALVLELLEWIGPQPRSYAEVIDAWRTSCPGLPVWEEANARGYLVREHREGAGAQDAQRDLRCPDRRSRRLARRAAGPGRGFELP